MGNPDGSLSGNTSAKDVRIEMSQKCRRKMSQYHEFPAGLVGLLEGVTWSDEDDRQRCIGHRAV